MKPTSLVRRATFTRPNDTTTYAAGDVIGPSTGTPTVMTFPECAVGDAEGGLIQAAYLIDSANQALKLDSDLFLFTTAPTGAFGVDNAAFTPTDAQLLECVGVIPFSVSNSRDGNATGGATGNAVNFQGHLAIPFKCALGLNALYGILVARNAYIPIAQSPFFVNLHIMRDQP